MSAYTTIVNFWDTPSQLEQSTLFDGALWVARDAYPNLDFAEQHHRIGELAAPLVARGVSGLGLHEQAAALSEHLSSNSGFRGNQEDYYAPENSYVNRVIDRRLGIPISLAVVYIAVAERAGLSATGVGFPGHFLMRLEAPEQHILIDPFAGRLLSRSDLEALLETPSRGKLRLHDSMLDPTPTRHVLARMLFNLRHIHVKRGDHRQLLLTLDRLVALMPEAHEHRRDRGLLCVRLGAPDLARADLSSYLEALPHASDADEVGSVLASLARASSRPLSN